MPFQIILHCPRGIHLSLPYEILDAAQASPKKAQATLTIPPTHPPNVLPSSGAEMPKNK